MLKINHIYTPNLPVFQKCKHIMWSAEWRLLIFILFLVVLSFGMVLLTRFVMNIIKHGFPQKFKVLRFDMDCKKGFKNSLFH